MDRILDMDISIDLESQRLARKSMSLGPDDQLPVNRISEFLSRAQTIKIALQDFEKQEQQRNDSEEILYKLALECAEEIHNSPNSPYYLIIMKYMRQL
jgi:hypothetical protein